MSQSTKSASASSLYNFRLDHMRTLCVWRNRLHVKSFNGWLEQRFQYLSEMIDMPIVLLRKLRRDRHDYEAGWFSHGALKFLG